MPYIISVALGDEYKSQESLAIKIADMIENESGCKPIVGRRLPYIVRKKDPSREKKLVDHVCTMKSFLTNHMKLDVNYYFEKQFLLPVTQLLCMHPELLKRVNDLVQVIVNEFYQKQSNSIGLRALLLKRKAMV